MSDARIKRDVEFNISNLITIEHIKGMRHRLNLPVMANEHERMQVHNV